jgi:hypothetical protein
MVKRQEEVRIAREFRSNLGQTVHALLETKEREDLLAEEP